MLPHLPSPGLAQCSGTGGDWKVAETLALAGLSSNNNSVPYSTCVSSVLPFMITAPASDGCGEV